MEFSTRTQALASMLKKLIPLIASIILFFVPLSASAQTAPREISFCDVAKDPKSFDGRMIRVRGTMSVGFENFQLYSPDCRDDQSIWVAFGGDVAGVVASTVNDSFRKPGADIKVNDVSYGIQRDQAFYRFYSLISARNGEKAIYKVTATVTGAFFAGIENKRVPGHKSFMGYGHIGCCSLLVITQVSDVESDPPANLLVRGTVSGPDGAPLAGFTVFDEILGGTPHVRQQTTTNARGEFEFFESGTLLGFRDPRYRPVSLAVRPGGDPIHVKLEDAKQSDWIVPACDEVGGSSGRVGFSAMFIIPKKLEAKFYNKDISGDPFYLIGPRGRDIEKTVMHISAEPGLAVDGPDILADSGWSEQRWIKDSAGAAMGIDTRGRKNDGGHWRGVVFPGRASAGYNEDPGKRVSSLDKILDSACVIKQ
jgi:hypothetical protein